MLRLASPPPGFRLRTLTPAPKNRACRGPRTPAWLCLAHARKRAQPPAVPALFLPTVLLDTDASTRFPSPRISPADSYPSAQKQSVPGTPDSRLAVPRSRPQNGSTSGSSGILFTHSGFQIEILRLAYARSG